MSPTECDGNLRVTRPPVVSYRASAPRDEPYAGRSGFRPGTMVYGPKPGTRP